MVFPTSTDPLHLNPVSLEAGSWPSTDLERVWTCLCIPAGVIPTVAMLESGVVSLHTNQSLGHVAVNSDALLATIQSKLIPSTVEFRFDSRGALTGFTLESIHTSFHVSEGRIIQDDATIVSTAPSALTYAGSSDIPDVWSVTDGLVWADLVFPQVAFNEPGQISAWSVGAARNAPMHLCVYRPCGNAVYELVGSNFMICLDTGTKLPVHAHDRISVHAGDVIGVRCLSRWTQGLLDVGPSRLHWSSDTAVPALCLRSLTHDAGATRRRIGHAVPIVYNGVQLSSAPIVSAHLASPLAVSIEALATPRAAFNMSAAWYDVTASSWLTAAVSKTDASIMLKRKPAPSTALSKDGYSTSQLAQYILARICRGVQARQAVAKSWDARRARSGTVPVGSHICTTSESASRIVVGHAISGDTISVALRGDADISVTPTCDVVSAGPACADVHDLVMSGLSCHASVLTLWAILFSVEATSHAHLHVNIAEYALNLLTTIFQQLEASRRSSLRACLARELPGSKELLGRIIKGIPALREHALACLGAGVQVIVASPADVLLLLETDAHIAEGSASSVVFTALLDQQDYICSCFIHWLSDGTCAERLQSCIIRSVAALVVDAERALPLLDMFAFHLTTTLFLVTGSTLQQTISILIRTVSELCAVVKTDSVAVIECFTLLLSYLSLPSVLPAVMKCDNAASFQNALLSLLSNHRAAIGADVSNLLPFDNLVHTAVCLLSRIVRLKLATSVSAPEFPPLMIANGFIAQPSLSSSEGSMDWLASEVFKHGVDVTLCEATDVLSLTQADTFTLQAAGLALNGTVCLSYALSVTNALISLVICGHVLVYVVSLLAWLRQSTYDNSCIIQR